MGNGIIQKYNLETATVDGGLGFLVINPLKHTVL